MPNSSHRVLRNAALAGLASVEAPPARTVVVGESNEAAYERGRRDGIAAGRAQALGRIAEAGSGIERAVAEARRAMAATREEQSAAVVAAALELAAEIVGRTPAIDSDLLVERIADALVALDERGVTLHLSREDHAALGDAMADRFGLEVAADATLQPGEARLTGAWARAELTREAAVGAIREAL